MPERRWGEWTWEVDEATVYDIDEPVLAHMIDQRIARMGGELAVALTRHVRRVLDVARGRIADDD